MAVLFKRMLILLFLITLLFLAAWGYYSSQILMGRSVDPITVHPYTFGYKFDHLTAHTSDGIKLCGWFVPARQASDATLIILHGWGSNRSDLVERSIYLAQHYNLIYFDFRNHGESGRDRTSLLYLELKDLDAIVNYLKKEKPQQSKRLGLIGCSMGGAVALTAAGMHPEFLAVVAESPFASFNATVGRYATQFYNTPRFLVPVTLLFLRWRLGVDSEQYSPLRYIGKIAPRPIFLIQSDKDERMPLAEGQSLFAAAQDPKELWTDHNGAEHGYVHRASPQEYQERLNHFFQTYIPVQTQ